MSKHRTPMIRKDRMSPNYKIKLCLLFISKTPKFLNNSKIKEAKINISKKNKAKKIQER